MGTESSNGILRTLSSACARFQELETAIADPALFKDQRRTRELMQEHAALRPVYSGHERLRELDREIEETTSLLDDSDGDEEMADMAREELERLRNDRGTLIAELRVLLIPKDPRDRKNVIMEIRAGTGGDEATLFAADLFRMYSKYADLCGWKLEMLSSHGTEVGGFKEVVFSITGTDVFAHLRYESGVHRVQRVPVTESSGRIHTSAVTVAVLPEAEEADVALKPEDLRIDVFRSSGPGGQSVNTTDSAVRITHVPSGVVVTCQDEKSQHKNKAKALRVLRARLLEAQEEKVEAERAAFRRSQIGSGDRSERIRTYNFPQNRVTDHRVNLTLYKLEEILLGALGAVVATLQASERDAYLNSEAS
ncbi:MAG: peptide chain release factor 1 [Spirochaetaceae bacterium]|nr:peptide chain release factor 1 [Spirochaetaceae bacterium]